LFVHCLLKANYKNKKWRGIDIKRGSFITSLENLSTETGLSIQQTRTALDKLISTNEITNKSTSHYRIIAINNYNEYQASNKPINKQVTNNQQTNQQADNKQVTTTIEGIEGKEVKNTYMSFIEKFNEIVGSEHRGDSKSKAQFNARIKEGKSLEDFIKAVTNASKDKYLMGENNSGRRFLTPEYITRADTLDNWLSQKPKDKWAGYKFV
jgi:uncharacterized phage protein (TIGR02220 family)